MIPEVEEMKKHPILTVIGILFLVVLVSNIFNSGGSLNETAKQNPAAATQKPKSRMPATVATMFDSSLKQAFGNNYETRLDQDAGIFYVDTWSDDVNAQYIADLKAGGDGIDVWNQTVESVRKVTSSMQSTFDEVCSDPITVVSSICDPVNHDIAYLTVANGVAGYDAVNEIDLLNK